MAFVRTGALAGALLLIASLASAAGPAAVRGIGVDETLDRPSALAAALEGSGLKAAELPLFVRLSVRREQFDASADATAPFQARLDLYARLGVRVAVSIDDPPIAPPEVDAWRATLRAAVGRARGRVFAWQVGGRADAAWNPKDYAYLLKFVAVQSRSIDPSLLIVEASLPPSAADWHRAFEKEDVAAYVDATPIDARGADEAFSGPEQALALVDSLASEGDPTLVAGLTGIELADGGPDGPRRVLGWHLAHLGGRGAFTTFSGDTAAVRRLVRAVAALADVVGGEVTTLDERAVQLKLSSAGRDVAGSLPHRLLYNTTTFSTYLVCWRAPGEVTVSLQLAAPGDVAVRDAEGGVAKPRGTSRDEKARESRVRIDLAGGPAVIDFNHGSRETYALRAEATERVTPPVSEIVFRHQQAEAAQAERLRSYAAHARMELHFRPSATDSGYDVVTENRFFFDRSATEWEEESFSLNGTKWGRDRPAFPLLQPEKVLALPLALRLNRDYVYHLDGVGSVGGRRCYVVRFDPVDDAESRYRGTVWIDAESFVRLKVQAVQTRLGAPVVSNEETQSFEPVAVGGQPPIHLFTHLVSRQIVLIAGRNLLVEKQVTFSDFRVNDPAFDAARREARQGRNVMYRDTERGLRYLVKQGGERVVSDRATTTARAVEAGATIDPTFDYPLPIVGINYLDFDFLGRDLQFACVFAGVLAVGNVQKAKIGGTKVDLNVDFFGMAVTGNDQVFDSSGERRGERLKNRPASVGANLGYQFTDFQKVTVSSHARYDRYLAAGGKTDAAFVVPATTVTFESGASYEYRRAGYSVVGSFAASRRARWEHWGFGDEFDPADRSFTKYSVGLTKDFYLNAFNKLHLNGAYYGGRRQDRFSMYRFGMFDETKMHGVPSAGIRFSELALTRAQYSFNLFDLYRLDVFLDRGWGRVRSRTDWERVTGVGTELNVRGPRGTMLKLGVGKGFLPEIYRGSGSVVVDVLVLKPL